MNKEDIENTRIGRLESFKNHRHLLVSFGGIQAKLGIPVFEFFNSIDDLPFDKIFLRDFEQSWYQKGVDLELNSLEKVTNYLKSIIEINNYESVSFMGNSMGAYAAILFGTILNVDNVIAFAPQTFIDKLRRRIYKDKRWGEQINKLHKDEKKEKKYHDLKRLIATNKNLKSYIRIYYSPADKLDKIHATRLSKFKNVHLKSYSKGGHAVVKTLRDSGELHKILNDILKN